MRRLSYQRVGLRKGAVARSWTAGGSDETPSPQIGFVAQCNCRSAQEAVTRVGEAAPVGEDVQAHLVEFGAAVGVQGAALFVCVLGGLLGGEPLVVVSAGGEAGGVAAHGAVELGGVTGKADVGKTGAHGFLSADG